MKIEFLSIFSRDLDSINQKSIKSSLIKLIGQIEKVEKLNDIPKIKKLVGHKSAYRIRIGDYRIGFFFEDQKIIFARIIHRKDIYKLFP